MVISKLRQNIAALGSIQVANYLFPVITLPYVTRVLGVDAWGTLAWVQIVIGYFALITNWGFSISGTRKIASIQENNILLSKVFISTWCAQWLLGMLCIAVILLLIHTVPFFSNRYIFFLWGSLAVATNILFPIWFLIGLEQMRTVAVTQILSRVVTLPLIFILIEEPKDAHLIVVFGVVQNIIGGVLALMWISKNVDISWRLPSVSDVGLELKDGFSIFISTLSIGLYTTITPTILGVIAGNTAVGFYSLADKTRVLGQSLLSPISQALFPRMSSLFSLDREAAWNLIYRSSRVIIMISATTSLLLYMLADLIVYVLAGNEYKSSVPVLQLMAFLPFIISISNIFGMQILLPNNHTMVFNRILFSAGLLSLVLIVPLIQYKAEIGAATNVLIIETFVTLGMGFYVLKYKNNRII